MKKFYSLFVTSLIITQVILAQSFNIEHFYPIETSHSFIQFEVTYMGYAKVRGTFGDFYGSIYYNPDAPEQTSVSFQVDVESIDTDNDWRDRDLKSGNWFLAEKHPHITFSSTSVQRQENGFLVKGNLSIKDTTKQIEFRIPPSIGVINDIRGDDQIIFTGEYTLNRKEYGVMGKNWSTVKEGIVGLSNEVTIEFSLLGKQVNEDNFKNFVRNPKSPHGSIHAAYKENGVKGALAQYEKLVADTSKTIRSSALNMAAYMLMKQEKFEDAKVLMERNQKDFPEDSNVYDSLAELHANMKDLNKAKTFYRKSYELDSSNMNAKEALKHLGY